MGFTQIQRAPQKPDTRTVPQDGKVTSTNRSQCTRCGGNKPPWFVYCGKCFALVQLEQMAPNGCDEQDCEEIIDEDHFLCRRHWQASRDGVISECLKCGEYKPANFPLCRRCNTEAISRPARSPQPGRSPRTEPKRRTSNIRRVYDHHDGEDDQKAKDKRYWFNRQNNSICSTLLLEHHLKELKLPTFLREYRKLAAQCAAEGSDHPDYLLRLSALELIDRH